MTDGIGVIVAVEAAAVLETNGDGHLRELFKLVAVVVVVVVVEEEEEEDM